MKLKVYSDAQFPILGATLLKSLCKDLGLRNDLTVYLQGLHTELDKYGEPMPNTAHPGVKYDGDAHDNGTVRICISPHQTYPETWNINPELKGGYINHIMEFQSKEELFLAMAAHELRHIWQWENPDKAKQIRRLLKCDDETDSDIYAIRKLSEYRSKK